jgi:hypothetical protein
MPSHLISTYPISYNFIPSHLISSHLIPSYLISSHIISYHIISSHIILSCLIPSHPIPSNPIQFHPIPSHLIPSHPISCHLISSPVFSSPLISFLVSALSALSAYRRGLQNSWCGHGLASCIVSVSECQYISTPIHISISVCQCPYQYQYPNEYQRQLIRSRVLTVSAWSLLPGQRLAVEGSHPRWDF